MNTLLYWLARGLVEIVQTLPLVWVARLGRIGGGWAFYLTARHRRVALTNLTESFPEKTADEIREIAKENFRRLGENYLSAIKTAAMTAQQMRRHFEIVGAEKILPFQNASGSQNRIMAIGHFGNFELYARSGQFIPNFKFATTYRGLKQPALNRLLIELRNRADCQFYERRTACEELKTVMSGSGTILGLLADQHAGSTGLRLPFFGRDCSTSAAPAIFALRYNCPLHTAICYRTGPARWRIEVGEEIPTCTHGESRSTFDIMGDVNCIFESAIRRDPANWFWVHRRWKLAQKVTRKKIEIEFRPMMQPRLSSETRMALRRIGNYS